MKRFFQHIWSYLKDWKNLLGHTLVGIAIVLVATLMPLPWWGRILVLIAIIMFNIYRERLFARIFGKNKSLENKVKE